MSIADKLRAILEARYGKDVRQSIHDAIEECYYKEVDTVQSDWNQTDPIEPDFIKNKPNITSLLAGKVDKVSGKGLSANDYTTTEKNKLAGIAAGAEVNVQSDWNQTTTTAKDYIKNKPTIPAAQIQSDWNQTNTASKDYIKNKPNITSLLDGKVDKVSGKVLSTNDYTTTEKNKLAGIETGANKTIIDSSLTGTSTNPVQSRVILSALDGKVDKVSGKGLSSNDFTNTEQSKLAGIEANANYIIVDTALSTSSTNPVQNKVVNAALGNKVDKVSGKRLSTNDYTTSEKNKLAGIAAGAEVNVQPDWNQTDTTAKDYIKNKPSTPSGQVQADWSQTDSTQPDYIKNKPSTPSGQVQADWNQTTTTEPDYIKNKPNINAKADKGNLNYRDDGVGPLTSMANVETQVMSLAANSIMPKATAMVHYTIEFEDYSDTPFTEDSSGSIIISKSDSFIVFSCLFIGASDIVFGAYDGSEWTWRNLNGVDPANFLPKVRPTVTGELTINYAGDDIPVGETLSCLNGCYEYDGSPTESNRMNAMGMLIGYKGNCTVRYTATSGHPEYSYFMTNFTGVNDTITFMEVSPAGEIVIWSVDGNTYVITKVRTI